MLKCFHSLIYFFLFSMFIFGNNTNKYINQLINESNGIRQIENSDPLLKKYLLKNKIKDDRIYAILFSPQTCPRCEVDVNWFFSNIKNIDPKATTLLIASYPDSVAAIKYIKEKNYKADHIIIDSHEDYKKFFDFSLGALKVVYQLKINGDGRLMVGGDCPTLNAEYIHAFYNTEEVMPYSTYAKKETDLKIRQPETSKNKYAYNYQTITLKKDNSCTFSSVLESSSYINNKFIYVDELANSGYVFNVVKDSGYQVHTLMPDDLETRKGVNIPDSVYLKMKKDDMIFEMMNSVVSTAQNNLACSVSLPDLSIEEDGSVAYYNMAAIIQRDQSDFSKKEMLVIERPDLGYPYGITHYYPYFLQKDRFITFGFRRGWPISAEDMAPKNSSPLKDPFINDFYKSTPVMAMFDVKTGEMVNLFGSLSEIHQRTKTGYFFTNPVIAEFNSKVAYTDGFSGSIFISDFESIHQVEREITVFDHKDANLIAADSVMYTMNYFMVHESLFKKSIEQLILTEDLVHCLIREGKPFEKKKEDVYTYKQYLYDGTLVNSYEIEYKESDYVVLDTRLSNNYGKISPYYFYKKENELYIDTIVL